MKTECPNCGKISQVPDEYKGRKLKCPKCGEVFRSTGDVMLIDESPATLNVETVNSPFPELKEPQVTSQTKDEKQSFPAFVWRKLTDFKWGFLGFFFLIYAWGTWEDESRIQWFLGSLSVVAFVTILFRGTIKNYSKLRKIDWRWGIIPGVLCAIWYHSQGIYYERWEKDGVEYLDTYSRSGRKHIYRTIWFTDESSPYRWAEGGISESGKLHGKWEFTLRNFKTVSHWYFYGEEVTEAEWHRSNK